MTLTWLPKIRACHPHVACTRNAEILVARLLVPVCQDTLDLHRPVDQNVVSTPIVPWILLAWTRNAKILVKDLVALRPYAQFTITCQYALVLNNTLVILSAIVILLLDQVRNLKKSWKRLRDQESYIYSFHSWTNYRWSLCIITLWSKRAVQRWCLYMFGRISGWSLCRLSTRVCIEHRLSPKSSLCEKQVYQSLFWYLWSKCRMFGI